jgi:hypothetical protein
MYNLASKILPLVLDPLVLAIVLLVCSFVVRKRLPKVFQITYVVSVILLLVAACPTVEGWLTGSLERQYPDAGADSYPSAQAIVVLGGTIHMPSMVHHASGIINPSDRCGFSSSRNSVCSRSLAQASRNSAATPGVGRSSRVSTFWAKFSQRAECTALPKAMFPVGASGTFKPYLNHQRI